MTVLIFLIITPFLFSTVLSREPSPNDSDVENVIGSVVGDELSSEIATNNTRAYLSCESGEMVVKINFTEPYLGVIYTNYDRSSPCKLYGDGRQYYEIRIPLKGCGTKQKVSRVFINNILVRFHRSLELDEDEVKTIICRYPPPLAPPPNNVIPLESETAPPLAAIATPKLSEVEMLLIVCALLFLTLLLLGVGVAYYCLKKRNVKIVRRRRAASSAPGSEITKLSSSTRGPITTIGTINIPRASAISGSGSDAALLTSGSSQHGSGGTSETLPSDYPSESPSSINSDEEMDGHKSMSVQDISSMRNGGYRFHNSAFIPDEGPTRPVYPSDHDNLQSTVSFAVETTNKPLEYRNDGRKQKIVKHMLSTIIEREDSVQTESFSERITRQRSSSKEEFSSASEYVPHTSLQLENLKKDSLFMSYTSSPSFGTNVLENRDYTYSKTVEFLPVKKVLSPPSHCSSSLYGSIPDNDDRSQIDIDVEPPVRPYIRKPKLQVSTLDDYFLDTKSSTKIQEDKTVIRRSHLPGDQMNKLINSIDGHNHEENLHSQPKSQVTLQNTDEVYFSKMDETNLTEYFTKHRKEIAIQHSKASVSLDFEFRNHSPMPTSDNNSESKDWGKESEKVRDNEITITEPEFKAKFRSQDTAYADSKPQNKFSVQDIMFRVTQSLSTNDAKEMSVEDKEKWKKLIHSDKIFRSLIQEATTTEELTRISRDKRYEHLYTPKKWQVIIRVLTAPDYNYTENSKEQCQERKQPRYKKKIDYDSRGRKTSLAPLYEVDSETSFSNRSSPVSVHSRRRPRSVGSLRDFDWRSITEMDVDFTHADKESLWSLDTYRTVRSAAERSCSEFAEEVPTISSRHRSSQFSILERLTPETNLRSKDCESNYDYDGVSMLQLAPSSRHQNRFMDARRNCPVLERSSTEITITSPILRTLDRASSVGEREEIKSMTETEIYDWQR
ncbi:uncharacterized protein LOC143244977 [Tachypleus tridentatus]|uniref:uncharacterized protein LOC143244977 n=1 Tax=Tachypleus tridentatus TaxID=6853 RepID=UPI003FD2B89C